MKSPLSKAAVDLITVIRQKHESDKAGRGQWLKGAALAVSTADLKLLASGGWDCLAAASREQITARLSALGGIVRSRELTEGARMKKLAIQGLAAAAGAELPSKKSRWAALRSAFIERMKADGKSESQIKPRVSRLEALFKSRAGKSADSKELAAASQLRGLMISTTLLAVAKLNEAAARPPAEFAEPAGKWHGRIVAEIEAVEKSIWRALREGDLSAASGAGKWLASRAARVLFDEAIPRAAQQAAMPSAADDQAACRTGDVIRGLLRAITLGQHIEQACSLPKDAAILRPWLEAASRLDFPSRIAWPPVRKISELANNPKSANGKACTIEGRLVSIRITHRGRKAISTALVADAAGNQIAVAIPYIKLDSGGMVPGAAVRIAGVWRSLSKEAGGPALDIDRIHLGELARRSWSDFATHSLREVFSPVPHSLACGWSWQPGTDGAGNAVRYRVSHSRPVLPRNPSAENAKRAFRVDSNIPAPVPGSGVMPLNCDDLADALDRIARCLEYGKELEDILAAIMMEVDSIWFAIALVHHNCLSLHTPDQCRPLDMIAQLVHYFAWVTIADKLFWVQDRITYWESVLQIWGNAWFMVCLNDKGDYPHDPPDDLDFAEVDEIESELDELEGEVAEAEGEFGDLLADAENAVDDADEEQPAADDAGLFA